MQSLVQLIEMRCNVTFFDAGDAVGILTTKNGIKSTRYSLRKSNDLEEILTLELVYRKKLESESECIKP